MIEIITLQERIEQGGTAILKAQAEGKDTAEWEKHLVGLKNRLLGLLGALPAMKLAEFEKQNLSIEVYAEVLGGTVWFCPDKEMAAQVKRDDSEAICYTQAELRHLIALNPGPESLRKIHEVKEVFRGGVISSNPLKEANSK